MKIKSITNLRNLQDKTVLLRVDFNVPMTASKIRDDFKIRASLETINFLQNKGAKIILLSHLGKPQGKREQKLSLAPIARYFRKISKLPIRFSSTLDFKKINNLANNLLAGEILFLENIRFHQGEIENDKYLATQLALLADLYVNDAFAVSHRSQTSVSAIQDLLPSYAGILLKKELQAMEKIFSAQQPFIIIMGGVKINTKAPLIKNLYTKASYILVGGALANNFLKFKGHNIGKSYFDLDSQELIQDLLKNKRINKKLVLPLDFVVKAGDHLLAKTINQINQNDIILDIGPETVSLYANYIKQAQTLIWNGPMGKFEEEPFHLGTLHIARLVASRSSGRAYGVVGGGETVEALQMSNMAEYVDWISTGGGAMLAYLGKEKMPGFKNIIS